MDPADPHTAAAHQSTPGSRFQARYWRHRQPGNRRSLLARLASLVAGAVLAILGVAMLVLPGPGLLSLAAAGALFASESLRVARLLDWMEVRGRELWQRWAHRRGK